MKSDSLGFLIADEPLKIGDLSSGIAGVRNDTSAILALMQKDGKTLTRQRQAVTAAAPPRAARSAGQAAARDPATGRFVTATAKPINELSKAVDSLTRQQAAEAAVTRREIASRKGRGEDLARTKDGRFVGKGPGLISRLRGRLGFGLPGMGMAAGAGDLGRVDPTLQAGSELGGILGGPARLAMKALRFAGKGGGMLLRRLPLVGGLLAGGSALASIFGGDDPNKTAEQNREDRFSGAGSGIGMIAGGAIGSLLGPVGTVVGGIIGDKVGELVGKWLSTLDWTEIGTKITGGWDSTVGYLKDKWDKVTAGISGITTSISNTWTAIITGVKSFLKDKFGVDVDAVVGKLKDVAAPAVEGVKSLVAPVVEKAKPVVEAVKSKAGAALDATIDYGKERVQRLAEPVATAVGNVVDYGKGLVGKGSKGNKAALVQGMDAAGISDPTERAMFMAQMDHESGGFRKMDESLNYKPKRFLEMFGKRAGITTEAQAKAILDQGEGATAEAMYGGAWGEKKLGNTQPGDALAFKGRGFIGLTGRANYTAAAEATGLDLVNHPELASDPQNAAKIATWYWKSRSGLSDAAKAGDVVAASSKINGGTNGLQDRKDKFKAYLAEATPPKTADAAASAAPALMASAAPVTPARPPSPPSAVPPVAPPPPPPAVEIPIPMDSKPAIAVTVSSDKLAGQDLKDRQLARIATGGLG